MRHSASLESAVRQKDRIMEEKESQIAALERVCSETSTKINQMKNELQSATDKHEKVRDSVRGKATNFRWFQALFSTGEKSLWRATLQYCSATRTWENVKGTCQNFHNYCLKEMSVLNLLFRSFWIWPRLSSFLFEDWLVVFYLNIWVS